MEASDIIDKIMLRKEDLSPEYVEENKIKDLQNYNEILKKRLEIEYNIAKTALEKGYDTSISIGISPAHDIAAKVESLVGPPNVAQRIREILKEKSRDESVPQIVDEIIEGKFGKLGDDEKVAEQCLRTALTILTEGIVAASIEGITRVKIYKNYDGTKYLTVYFAGPIRSAGATAQATIVLIADYVRDKLGLDVFKPNETEVERYVEEINLYHNSIARLQYNPTDDEIRWIVTHCPICISGETTTTVEVSGYRDLERIETNCVRGGMCLVTGEGIAQKAAKLLKYSKKIKREWPWLEKLIKVDKGGSEKKEIKPLDKYLSDVVGGRPIFAYPSQKGGFRLRYGRARNSGMNAKCLHPATLEVLDEFPAVGTQLKIEKPGKGMAVAPCNMIEPPIVKLKDGSVIKVNSCEKAKELAPDVKQILFLGDILMSFGDFSKSNHPLLVPGFCEEWWRLLARQKEVKETCESFDEAFEASTKYGIPMHPEYTHFYNDITTEEFCKLIEWLAKADFETISTLGKGKITRMVLENAPEKELLEKICLPHKVTEGRIIIEDAEPLIKTLGLPESAINIRKIGEGKSTNIEIINAIAPFKVIDKSGSYIGARMGRPEKAKERMMNPAPNGLIPVGLHGGKTRNLMKAIEKGKISIDLPYLICPNCNKEIFGYFCRDCNTRALLMRKCTKCGRPTNKEECEKCKSPTIAYHKAIVDMGDELKNAASRLNEKLELKIKGVVGTVNKDRLFEPIEKAILRSKHNVYVFKEGTIRFDASNLPVTYFKPSEIMVPIEKLKELGYEKDYKGNKLKSDDQIIEIKPQDMIISERCADYLIRTSKFIDDLLVKFYKMEPFYKIENRSQLPGTLMIALAPHTSAGALMRILGFTRARVNFSHPFAIAARRRDCFHPDTTFPIFDGETWQIVKIGEFADKILNENQQEKGYATDAVAKINSYSTLSLGKNGLYEMKPITAFSRHMGAEHLVTLKTKGNKEITTTGTHEFVADIDHSRITPLAAEKVLVPKLISIPEKNIECIDLLKLSSDYIMVQGMQKELKKEIQKQGGLKKCAEKIAINKKTLFNYTKRNSAPYLLLKKLGMKIPRNVLLNAKHDTVAVPRFIKVDKDFLHLVGLYISEGYARKSQDCYQVAWCNSKLNKLILGLIKNSFGISAYKAKEEVVVCSRLIHDLFTKILNVGSTAHYKRVPNIFLALPLEKLKYLLQGYFEGDGGVYKANTVEVHCTSVNKMLLKDIEFILMRYGIQCGWMKDERVATSGKVYEFNKKKNKIWINKSYKLRMYGENSLNYKKKIGFVSAEKSQKLTKVLSDTKIKTSDTDSYVSKVDVKKSEIIKNNLPTYNITVADNHNFIASGITAFQCDGDEDAVMLLMDGLINFSKSYLSSKMGGHMDAPLVLTTVIDPGEVDDQAHDMEVTYEYPLKFYEAACNNSSPAAVEMPMTKQRLGKPNQSVGIGFTHDTTRIDEGPTITRYVQLKTMKEKVETQLALAEKIRAVNTQDAAARIINFHFMRDLYGNLRAFGQQKFRCVECNEKYRRPPLIGKCSKCGGKLLLTVNKGGIQKYLKLSQEIAEKYELSDYVKQRLKLLETDLVVIFQSDKIKQQSLSDFM